MPFEYQPVLRGELVELRPLRPEDFHGLYAVAGDPLIWELHPDKSRHTEAGFRTFFDEALKSCGALVVIDLNDQRIIGSSRFYAYNEERSEVEIGWTFLARSCWGGVYNREMKRLMLEHAFCYVRCVIFNVGIHNLRSQRAVEKIGGEWVGTSSDAGVSESFVYRLCEEAFRRWEEG